MTDLALDYDTLEPILQYVILQYWGTFFFTPDILIQGLFCFPVVQPASSVAPLFYFQNRMFNG